MFIELELSIKIGGESSEFSNEHGGICAFEESELQANGGVFAFRMILIVLNVVERREDVRGFLIEPIQGVFNVFRLADE